MKVIYSFELVLDLDLVPPSVSKSYVDAAKESVDEFVSDLQKFIEKQPLIEGCKLTSETTP